MSTALLEPLTAYSPDQPRLQAGSPDQPRDEKGRYAPSPGGPAPKEAGDRPSRPPGGFKSDKEVAAHAAGMVAAHEADPKVQALVAARDEAAKAHDEAKAAFDAKMAGTGPASLPFSRALENVTATREALEKRQEAVSHESRQSFLQSFGVPPGEQAAMRANNNSSAGAKVRDANWEKTQGFVGRVSRKDAIGDQQVSLSNASSGRAFYSSGTLHTAKTDSAAITVHELGHHLEENPHVQERVKEFSEKRFGNEQPRDMASIDPAGGYKGGQEMGRKDEFEKLYGSTLEGQSHAYYTGKTYGNHQTEIVSMGLEHLYRDPVHMAKADPEYFGLTVGILQRGK